jgi:ABC-type cobalamin transport system permease subunit
MICSYEAKLITNYLRTLISTYTMSTLQNQMLYYWKANEMDSLPWMQAVLPNHVKYCVSVCIPSYEQKSVHHRSALGEPESPTIGIRVHGLKGCLIFAQK